MASRKKAKRSANSKRVPVVPPGKPGIYLGCFSFDRPGKEHWEGTFQVVVEADHAEQAVDRIRNRLRALRDDTSLFQEPVSLYLEGIVELRGSFTGGLLVNYESGQAPPPPNGRLMCMIPEQDDTEARSYDFRMNDDDEDDAAVVPFLDFGGLALAKALAEVEDARGAPTWPATALPSAVRQKPTVGERAAARAEAEAKKVQRQAERDTKKKERERVAAAKLERRRLIETTLAELGNPVRRNRTGAKDERA